MERTEDRIAELQREKEARRIERKVYLILIFFLIGAIVGLILYAIFKVENIVYMLPVFFFALAIIIVTIIWFLYVHILEIFTC